MTNMKGRRTSSSADNSAEGREAQRTMLTAHHTANSTLWDHSAQRAVSWQIRHSASLRQGSLDSSFELAEYRHFNVTSQETEQQRPAVSPIAVTEQVRGNMTVDDTDPQFHAPARSPILEHQQEGAEAIPAQSTVVHPLQDEQTAPQLASAPMKPGRPVSAASSPQEDPGKPVHPWNLTHAELVELLVKSSDRVYGGPDNSLRLVNGLDGSERASISREKPCPQPPARNSTSQRNMDGESPRPSSTISPTDTLLDSNAADGSLLLFGSEQLDSPTHSEPYSLSHHSAKGIPAITALGEKDKCDHQWMKHATTEGEGKAVDDGLPSWWAFTQYPPREWFERRFAEWGGSKLELVPEPLEVQVNMMQGGDGDGEKPKKWGDLMDMLNEPDESEEALEARRKELEEMARRRKAWAEKEAREKEEEEERAKEWERAREKKEKEQREMWRKEREEKEENEKKEKDKAKKIQNEGKGVEKGKGKEKAVDEARDGAVDVEKGKYKKEDGASDRGEGKSGVLDKGKEKDVDKEKGNESDGGLDVGKGKADDEAVDAETSEVVGKGKNKGKAKKKNKRKGKGKK